jgi:NAD(P)-dependent dehydrogenase (short-subunit alcohol dehydrogenase family)
VAVDGSPGSSGPAEAVAAEIRDLGGAAVANSDDVADFDGARRLVEQAVERFGRLDALVNNAGILRDRMLVNMSAEEWDAVIRVHLRGTFAPARWAAAHWRERSRTGEETRARIVNTSSASGIYGNPGQTNYGAAKAGIAAFTVIAAMELARYGVTVNAIAPSARTRMTEGLMPEDAEPDEPGGFHRSDPENVSPLVAWLVSEESEGISGRVFNIYGGSLSVAEGWHAGPEVDAGMRFEAETLGSVVPRLVAEAAPNADMLGRRW